MTALPYPRPAVVVLADAMAAHASELGIDGGSVCCPSVHAIAAWRRDGGLLRIDIGDWPAAELSGAGR